MKSGVVLPVVGEVFERDGKRRQVVAVHDPMAGVDNDHQIEWCRSGNEWKTSCMYLPAWQRWARNAVKITE